VESIKVAPRQTDALGTMRSSRNNHEIDEMLTELEINLKRLRLEYEQFFRGAMRREPTVLRGKVQKTINHFSATPPTNSALKFRFNSLNARFQSQRQLWGRTMREMEAGTYKAHQFKLKLHEREQEERTRQLAELDREEQALEERRSQSAAAASTADPRGVPAPRKPGSALDQLHTALVSARSRTGQGSQDLTREKLAALVKRQTEAIRAQRGANAKVKFKVVIEGNQAKLKATVA